MINLAIIDADSIAYLGNSTDSLQQILEKVDYKIQEILTETKADYYVLLVSRGKYFRHEISKSKEAPEGSYKANRGHTAQPWNKTIKEYLIVKYKAVAYPNLEADDICSWLMGKDLFLDSFTNSIRSPNGLTADEINIKKILVAMDKDLLYSIPGRHLNFNKKLGPNEWGMEWVETSEADAANFVKSQMIIGDSSDGIPGLYRKGEAYWKKISTKVVPSWGEILQLYIADYGEGNGIFEFQQNYRLLHMLSDNADMLREIGYIPQLPEFQKVISPTKEEIKIDF